MVKIAPRLSEGLLQNPGGFRAILLYGPDRGLVFERAERLVKALSDAASEPSPALDAEVLLDDPARLGDEAAAIPMFGGPSALWIRNGAERLGPLFEEFLAHPLGDRPIVLEAGELRSTSRLRKVFEAANNAAALACYPPEPAEQRRWIEAELVRAGLKPTAEALAYLADRIGADRLLARRELEKLMSYVGAEGATVGIEACASSLGDNAEWELEDVAFAAAGGELKRLERALEACFARAESPVSVLRAAERHFLRLYRAASSRDQGQAGGLSQRLPARLANALAEQIERWPTSAIVDALIRLVEAEISCKTTGIPDRAVCRHALFDLASRNSAGRKAPAARH
jgi:DNA polymerase-3 subunit delta